MKIKFFLFIFVIPILLALPLISAAHWITGVVNDARDGTLANDRTVILWNAVNGINDNLTDIIGLNGNSGTSNIYMFDCEMLNYPCNIWDKLSVKVINNSNSYISYTVNVTVTDAGYDKADDLTLNSPPNSTLNYPANNSNYSGIVEFNCTGGDLDYNLEDITLFGDWSGGWHANETQTVSGSLQSKIFTKDLLEGTYKWNCLVADNLSAFSFANQNFSFTVDRTSPVISSVVLNQSYSCGTSSYIRVNCSVTDNLALNQVIVETIKPSGKENFTTQLLSPDTYYADIPANEEGTWIFNCIANDSVGNVANLTEEFIAHPNSPDLIVYSYEINFSDFNPMENEAVIINATIHNNGCSDANNFLVGFYNGDPSINGKQINSNKTTSVTGLSNVSVNVNWNAEIGINNIFVIADVSAVISEFNESNNQANRTLDVNAWQNIYGNVSGNKVLSNRNFFNISVWANESDLGGSIFIVDKESDVDWLSLQAVSRNISNGTTSNDFSNIDSLLNMSSFNDSVSNIFANSSQQPQKTESFIIHQKLIENVPIINSTNNSNFITGILWDTSDDNGDLEFDINDKEDLVFVTKINKSKQGAFGVYDYEIKIPVRLRDYKGPDNSEVYLYYDLT